MFLEFEDIQKFVQQAQTASVVSEKLPLLSNLNMVENIALMLEVHQSMPVYKAESLAVEYLAKLGSETAGNKRIAQCSEPEVFYVKLIRAMFAPFEEILIVLPNTLTDSADPANFICKTLKKLQMAKKVSILDLNSNENDYLEVSCVTLMSK